LDEGPALCGQVLGVRRGSASARLLPVSNVITLTGLGGLEVIALNTYDVGLHGGPLIYHLLRAAVGKAARRPLSPDSAISSAGLSARRREMGSLQEVFSHGQLGDKVARLRRRPGIPAERAVGPQGPSSPRMKLAKRFHTR
jgi:hypothetical protein